MSITLRFIINYLSKNKKMDLKKYDELKKKNNKKDFEISNHGLDWWLFRLSFVGNALSIFFSIFLVYPGLLKAIEINIVEGFFAKFLAFSITLIFLVAFEVIKRYVIRNFSNEYVRNRMAVKSTGWLTVSMLIVLVSFYVSIVGSKNLGSIGTHKKTVVENQINSDKDKIVAKYEDKKKPKLNYIESLIEINKGLSEKMEKTPVGWESIKDGYRSDIKNNDKKIDDTKKEIDVLDNQMNSELSKLDNNKTAVTSDIDSENIENIILFIIIAVVSELLIFGGIYFREWYEYKLLIINEQKYEKFYLKRDRYRALITFIYSDGKAVTGDKVISGLELKELVREKANIPNSNKLVDEFFKDMDNIGVFNTVGKRRFISKTYQEALDIVENFDDTLRILENMK